MRRLSSFLGGPSGISNTQQQEDSKDVSKDNFLTVSTFDESFLTTDEGARMYQISFDGKLSTNLVMNQVTGNSSEPLYWIETAAWKKEPDLVFHQGSKAGPVIGSAILRKRNHTMTLKLGGQGILDDHQREEELATINQDKKWSDKAYTLATASSSTSQPRVYHFTRTQSAKDGVQGVLAKMAYYNWLITNVRRERVGLWLENPKGGISLTTGTLKLNIDTLDLQDDLAFLLYGIVAITERTRRDVQLTIQVANAA